MSVEPQGTVFFFFGVRDLFVKKELFVFLFVILSSIIIPVVLGFGLLDTDSEKFSCAFLFSAANNSLGDEHVGYQRLDFPSFKLSIVGGRPFSHGGDRLFRKNLLVQRFAFDLRGRNESSCMFYMKYLLVNMAFLLREKNPRNESRFRR